MELDIFFSTAKKAFEEHARCHGPICERFVRFCDKFTVKIRFADPRLPAYFMPALEHIEVPAQDSVSLTICIWDSADGKDKAPYPSWRSHRGYQWVNLLTDDKVRVLPEMHPSRLTALNLNTNEALFWINDIAQYAWFEQCRPLRTIFHWWGTPRNLHLVHGAAVGTASGGALLVGEGGAGKSTTALACLGSDLNYVSDDHCMVGFDQDAPYAYSIYNSAKLNMADNIERVPKLRHCIVNGDRLQTEKAMMFLQPHYPEFLISKVPLRAVLIPVVMHSNDTRVVATTWNEAAKALIPSTMTELYGAEVEDFYGMLRLIKSLPCYRLELGEQISQIAPTITEKLNQLSAQPVHSLQTASSSSI